MKFMQAAALVLAPFLAVSGLAQTPPPAANPPQDARIEASRWLRRADELRATGAYQEAIQAYEQARRLDPTNAAVYNGEGVAQYQIKKYALAEWAFKTALKYAPNDSQIASNLQKTQQAIREHDRHFRQTYDETSRERAARMPQSQPTSAIPQAQQAPSASTGPPAGANTCAEKTGTHIRNNCNYQIAVVIAAFQLGRDSFSLYPMSPGSSAPVPSNARIVAMCNVNMAQGHGAYLNGSNYGCR